MNPQTPKEAEEIFKRVEKEAEGVLPVRLVVCPPFPYLPLLRSSIVKLGSQDCFWEEEGAFTGEVSPSMLSCLNCEYVILGHSERRNNLGETSDMVSKKARAALRSRLVPILCAENAKQLKESIDQMSADEVGGCVYVFEPSWAISSNEGAKAASVAEIREAVALFRERVGGAPILYGGSVNGTNVAEIVKEADLQGALVGKSSLDAEEFIAMAAALL